MDVTKNVLDTEPVARRSWQSLFFNKVADLRPATLLRKRFWHRCFPVRAHFSIELLRWLLLQIGV